MDPVTALGLSVNIITLIGFTANLVKTAIEIKHSATGRTAQNDELNQLICTIQNLSASISEDAVKYNDAALGTSVVSVLQTSRSHCNELKDIIDKTTANSQSLSKAAGVAIKSPWYKGRKSELLKAIELDQSVLQRCLIQLLRSELLAREEQIKESMDRHHGSILTRLEDLDRKNNLKVLTSEVRTKIQDVVDVVKNAFESSNQERILNAIYVPDIDKRYQRVGEAEPKTYSWAVQDHDFATWLATGDGIFHFAGKPGSGKSTLMKHLWESANKPGTESFKGLSNWSGQKTLVLSKHFFFRHGSELDRTFSGLFRTLLYQSLQAVPALIPAAFPEHWDKLQLPDSRFRERLNIDEKEIESALSRLIDNSGDERLQEHCFCFYVDGLDEFQDSKTDTLTLVGKLNKWANTASQNLKMIVSSREENQFMSQLQAAKVIRLQERTVNDIRITVEARLNPEKNSLGHYTQKDVQPLIDMIIERASGVFLWVKLVVQVIREGLCDRIPISTLEAEIDDLPEDLQSMYESILSRISKRDHPKTAITLAMLNVVDNPNCTLIENGSWTCTTQLRRSLTRHIPLYCYYFLDEYLLNRDFLYSLPGLEPGLSQVEAERREEQAEKWVNRYCRGLVEVREDTNSTLPRGMTRFIAITHRSLYDFMETSRELDVSNYEMKGQDFLIKSSVAFLKVHNLSWVLTYPQPDRRTEPGTSAIINRNDKRKRHPITTEHTPDGDHQSEDDSTSEQGQPCESRGAGTVYYAGKMSPVLITPVVQTCAIIRHSKLDFQPTREILDVLQTVLSKYSFEPISGDYWNTRLRNHPEKLFRICVQVLKKVSLVHVAAFFHLDNYVSHELAHDKALMMDDWKKAMLLECALKSVWHMEEASAHGIEVILRGGVSPNLSIYPDDTKYKKPASAWQKWLRDLTECSSRNIKWTELASIVTALLLSHGADPNVLFVRRERGLSLFGRPNFIRREIESLNLEDEQSPDDEDEQSFDGISEAGETMDCEEPENAYYLSWSDGVRLPIYLEDDVCSQIQPHLGSSGSFSLRQYFESVPGLPNLDRLITALNTSLMRQDEAKAAEPPKLVMFAGVAKEGGPTESTTKPVTGSDQTEIAEREPKPKTQKLPLERQRQIYDRPRLLVRHCKQIVWVISILVIAIGVNLML